MTIKASHITNLDILLKWRPLTAYVLDYKTGGFMDTSPRTMTSLFFQLGLPADENQIKAFIDQHRPLISNVALTEADFWTEAQAAFLREALAEDSDWCALVDQLDCYLRM